MRPQFFQFAIFRAKIVAPFTDTMRFIDRDLRNVPVAGRAPENSPSSAAPARRRANGIGYDQVRAVVRATHSPASVEFKKVAAIPLVRRAST